MGLAVTGRLGGRRGGGIGPYHFGLKGPRKTGVVLAVVAVDGGLCVLYSLGGVLLARVGLLLILGGIVMVPYGQLWSVGLGIAHGSMGMGLSMSVGLGLGLGRMLICSSEGLGLGSCHRIGRI